MAGDRPMAEIPKSVARRVRADIGRSMVLAMPLAQTMHGALHYDIVDQTTPWQKPRDAIVFHHGIGSSAALWSGWLPQLVDRYRIVTELRSPQG